MAAKLPVSSCRASAMVSLWSPSKVMIEHAGGAKSVGMIITAMNEGRLHRFFTKPLDGDELRRALRELLGLPVGVDEKKRDRVARREEQLQRAMAPQRDDDGAWVIIPPDDAATP